MLIITTRKLATVTPSNGAYKNAIERRLGSYTTETNEEED